MKSIWFSPVTLKELNQQAREGLAHHLGILFIAISDDSLSAQMPVDSHTKQPMGILHGGASCALAETVGSIAAMYCVDQTQATCVGLEINVNHIKRADRGMIIGTAEPFHLGKTTQVWDIQIRNESNLLIAVSRLTVAVLKKQQPE